MTETHSLGEWEERFDEQFSYLLDAEEMQDIELISFFEGSRPNTRVGLKQFIRSLLLAQKEGFSREIEGMKYAYAGEYHDVGYNQALDDLLTKLDTNGI